MSFDEKNVFLFKLFATNPKKVNEIINLYQYDFISKLMSNQEPTKHIDLKDKSQFSLSFILKYSFNQRIRIKKKYTNITFKIDKYNSLQKEFNTHISTLNTKYISKNPYSMFVNSNMNDILSTSKKCEMFLHIQLHLVYYLLFLSDDEHKNFHTQKIKVFESFPISSIQSDELRKKDKISLINATLNFFSKNYHKHPLILKELNETSIEILIHIIVLNYYYTKKIKDNFLLKIKSFRIIQTLIMLQNQNKNSKFYVHVISHFLSLFAFQSKNNILNLIKLLNVTSVGIDKSRTIMSKMYSSIMIKSPSILRKVIINYILAILDKDVRQVPLLQNFLIEILSDILTSHDSEDYYMMIFEIFYKETLLKFDIKINNDNLSFEYFTRKVKKASIITKRMIEYIELILRNYSFFFKKMFPKIIYLYNSAFSKIFNIINILNNNTSFYYNNMNNKEIANSRKVLLNFFTINFDFIDKDTMISKMINFYLYPKINSLSKEKNIIIDYSGNEIQIEHNETLTTINLINHYADSETKTNTINAITNIFKIYPFNNIDTLCSILKYIIVNEDYNDKDNIAMIDENVILTEEDEKEVDRCIDIINENTNQYKDKIIEIVFEEIEKKTAEEFETINKPNEILYLIMSAIVKKNKYTMMEICLNCLKELLSTQSEIFSYEDDIAFINLLNKISVEEENEVLNEVKKMFITHQSKTSQKEKSNKNNSDEVHIKELLDDIKKQNNKMNICYSFRKLISFLSISAGSNTYINISLECLDDIFSFIKPYIIKTKDDSFYSSIIIKVFVSLFLSIKSNEDLRQFYLKLYQELLEQYISDKLLNDNSEISSKLFEVLVKIIKKLKSKTYMISLDVLTILFKIFEKFSKEMKGLTITSCISVCAYLIEYAKDDLSNYYSTIIKTAINYLKSISSSNEEKRSSAFLIYKILSKLDVDELNDYKDMIYDALTITSETTNDNVLKYHITQCLSFYQ